MQSSHLNKQKLAKDSVPNNFALVIGAMKCGTTSLFYYLSEHPQIAECREKESNFFVDDNRFPKGMTWYRSLWQWNDNYRIALEASPNYTMQPVKPNVAERIAQEKKNAEFRFIYIMRNPLARIESHISQDLGHGSLNEPKILERHLAFSKYAMQLDAFAETFGRDQLCLVLLEDLQRKPEAVLSRVCQFLEVEPNYKFQRLDVIRNSRETSNLYPLLHKLRHRSWMRSLLDLISPRLRQKLRKPLSRKEQYNYKLSEQDRAAALKQLQPDLARLESEYGIDVKGKWGLLLGEDY
ncbi:MAG: hypothetical protein BRC39_05950 [Cyanobacteria bacterium QH_7_48_89]|jgi:hypothetical protein|nr:MAG: hypothetical protein BRC39_05950 [Cyanobacteria bacterium QH_7_48_89]